MSTVTRKRARAPQLTVERGTWQCLVDTTNSGGGSFPLIGTGVWSRVGDLVTISVSMLLDNSTWVGSRDFGHLLRISLPFQAAANGNNQRVSLHWEMPNQAFTNAFTVSALIISGSSEARVHSYYLAEAAPNTISDQSFQSFSLPATGTDTMSMEGTYLAVTE